MENQIIRSVKISNFRCHENYTLSCEKETTLILGENGCGKTSVLEAIYIALQGKSFRAVDREIMRRDAEFYRIELEKTDGEKIVVVFNGDKKSFLVKDKKTARLPVKERYPIVLFLPEDLHLVASSPTRKREYFDRILAQLNSKYSSSLARYNKALKQRNELLKQEFVTEETMFSWNILLAKYGVEIRKTREQLIETFNEELTSTYRSIADNKDEIGLKYISYTGDVSESEYLKLLSLDFERDKLTGHTNFGVHKDNYEFLFNTVQADGSASRGEVRSVILALKFIEAMEAYKTLGKKPVVLLDDVFSELDKTRQKSLMKNFKNHQVILTSVEGVNI
ncbi:DNA replication and repair protein RecF [Candidatus Saccharibacteria bacterium]|nr:DNA replication and repair protein RecF [Candidatus Saccharibacteria bacterium]